MSKPSVFIFTLAAPVLTGMLIVPLLLVPAVQPNLGWWIIGAAAVASAVSVPLSRRIGQHLED